ncbi:hypothetical protein BS17DRAFT_518757 [Gyrodon lividus]|nr:hypothetical protein BS17DRAFT_518757 [Gyrodon lividus]
MSLPLTPTRRLRSESQSTTTQGNVDTLFVVLSSPPLPPVTSPRAGSKTLSSAEVTSYSPSHAGSSSTDTPTCPSSPAPLTIPPISRQDGPANSSPFTLTVRNASSPLPFTPTYQTTVDDSPFGPLIPDTPRSSAEMYGERPFSPIARVMGPSSAPGSVGSSATLSSRTNSMTSMRTVGSAGTLRRGSRLANEVVMDSPDDHGDDEEDNQRTSPFNLMSTGIHVNESVVSSLSERYPAPSTPPVVISPPASSVGIISAPSSPRSGGSEVVIDNDVVLVTEPHTRLQPQTLPPLSMLQVPSGARRSTSRSRSPGPSATSPTLSFASFLSPMSVSQSVPESERDEFMSIADGFSDWSASPVMPSANGQRGPLHDRAYNPFLDFEEVMSDGDGSDDGGSEHRNGSDGSDESWGSARRHQGEV